MPRALFLDRDGVINRDFGYVYRKEQFEFVDGIFDLTRAARREGYLVIVITNQSGIGRGIYGEADFQALMQWVRVEFEARGTGLDAIYHCPFHPEYGLGGYKRESPCRKPAPGMILQAARDHSLDLASSLLVGDSVTDMQAGEAAGVGRLFLLTGEDNKYAAAFPISNLRELIPFLTAPES
ncbi:MAG: HAD family hydrolase [Deltaproteobacteria bacterium]|jgi:D-glycero-D-manno-heptose 1,7-bisphosphate phosphatase|nr:HAD family hydrolase [Deltaproteobacteria bacterium]